MINLENRYIYILLIISFLAGALFMNILYLKLQKNIFKNMIIEWKMMLYRFIKNLITLIPVVFILVIVYFISCLFSFGSNLLPELIGAGISIVVINFILSEKDHKERKTLRLLLENKINAIYKQSRDLILKYIDFNEYKENEITRELLVNILGKKDLLKDTVDVTYIDINGIIKTEKIILIDNPYFIGKELKPKVDQMTNYASYLGYDRMTAIVKLEE
ncbi:MAG: hypothetical protein ACYDG2_24255, partial [Ruminiclostridium sp.]